MSHTIELIDAELERLRPMQDKIKQLEADKKYLLAGMQSDKAPRVAKLTKIISAAPRAPRTTGVTASILEALGTRGLDGFGNSGALAAWINADSKTVSSTLYRLKKDGKVTVVNGRWMLLEPPATMPAEREADDRTDLAA